MLGAQWSGVRLVVLLERLGRGLYSRAHGPPWTRAPARLQARLGGVLVPVIKPGRIVDVFHVQLRGEEERGSFQTVRACEPEEWPSRAAGARVAMATGGRRRRGTAPVEAADVEPR